MNDLDIIYGRIELLIQKKNKGSLLLQIANDPYDRSYNFFLNSQRPGQRLRSVPLHKIEHYKLIYLEETVTNLKRRIDLPIKFVGFTNKKWPQSQKTIQLKRDELE